MTAVERQSTPSAFMAERQVDSPSSRFTAVNNVNGRESSSNAPSSTQTHGTPTRGSVERQQGQSRVASPGPEKSTLPTQPSPKRNTENSSMPTVTSPATLHAEHESPHKRKRSGSTELLGSTVTASNHGLPIPKDPESPQDSAAAAAPISGASREASDIAASLSSPQDSYSKAQAQPYSYPSTEPQDAHAHWYARRSQEHAAAEQELAAEDRLRAALANDRHGGNDSIASYGTSPSEANYADQYDHRSLSQTLQDERKKRKRNFSNRTKTGCMTCRKRKKKCDETRPECNNCIRGGFMCTGYPSRGPWTKPGPGEPKQVPVPLQAKEGYDHLAGLPNSAPYQTGPPHFQIPHPPAVNREPLPSYRGHHPHPPPRVDTHQPPSHPGLDDRMSGSTLPSGGSPDGHLSSAISYSQSSAFPTPVSGHPAVFGSQAQHEFFKGRRPQHFGSEPTELNTPVSAHPQTLPHINILNPPQGPPGRSLVHATSAQDAARLALSHPASRAQTQKQLMLDGNLFYPFDKELVLERERCNAACWRFNTSTNPNNGVSPEERHRQFRDILQPRETISLSPTERSPVSVIGHVGVDVVVEAPFTCDYGYNIRIGSQVAIGKNCTILDTCEVRIGDRTVLGPNVNIYTEYLSQDPKKRAGSKGPHQGKGVVIEEDCWIGGNVTILPGIVIRKGSTVGAGSLINRNVPESVLVAGNPARVIKGIATLL